MSVHVDIHTINVWPHVYHQKRNRKHETRIRFIFSLLSHYYFAVATLRSPHQPSSACAAYMFVFTVFICAHTHCTIAVLQKKQHFSWLWKIRQKRPLKLQFQALAKNSQTKKFIFYSHLLYGINDLKMSPAHSPKRFYCGAILLLFCLRLTRSNLSSKYVSKANAYEIYWIFVVFYT